MQQTTEQKTISEHAGGHAIVSAVPGSGKTATMIERIGVLIDRGVPSSRILALLFNKSARDDFDARLRNRYAAEGCPEVFTYHAFGMRLCSALENSNQLPFANLDSTGRDLIRIARATLNSINQTLDPDERFDLGQESVIGFMETVDILKNGLYDGSTLPPGMKTLSTKLRAAYYAFEEARTNAELRSYTDLIVDPVRLANSKPEVAKYLANRYDHIIVDEFQDINAAQMALVQLVAGTRALVMVVGDEDQTIYRWRGARPDYMTHLFDTLFPGASHYTLSKTFRYGSRLSEVANNVIGHNNNRTFKSCVSALEIDTHVNLQMYTDSYGRHVAAELKLWQRNGRSLNEAAILVREYTNTIPIEIALQRENIPYRLEGAPPFVDRPESMLVRAYLLLCQQGGLSTINDSSKSRQMVMALLRLPTLYLRSDEMETIFNDTSQRLQSLIPIAERHLRNMSSGRKAFSIDRRMDTIEVWKWCQSFDVSTSAARFLAELYKKLNLFTEIRKQNHRPEVAEEKIRLLHNMIRLAESGRHTIRTFSKYLNEIAESHVSPDADTPCAVLTSIHRAKGLEWPLIIMPDLSEGLFPKPDEDISEENIEDERRLFYVGATRAKNRLILLAPFDVELVKASMSNTYKIPPLSAIKASRFLYEARLTP